MNTSLISALRQSQNRSKKAFTLIELLIAIAIIAILAAILFPVFGRARENARRSTCQSNLKQMSLGIFQYTQDYDEKFPPCFHNVNNAGAYETPDVGWVDMVQPYIKSYQLFQCPSSSTAPGTSPYSKGYVDYSANYNIFTDVAGVSLARLNNAANTIMVHEIPIINANIWAFTTGASRMAYVDWDNTSVWDPDTRKIVHLEGSNFAFADGHVKWLKPTNVKGTVATSGDFTFADAGL